MHKILTIFIAVVVTVCLAQRPITRFRNKRIPYEDDDYRDGDNDDDRPNDVRDNRQYDFPMRNPSFDMTRQTQFDIGTRFPPFGIGNRPPFAIGNRPQFDGGNQNPQLDSGNRNPSFDSNNRNPSFDSGNRNPQFDGGNRSPSFDSNNRNPSFDLNNRNPSYDFNPGPQHESLHFAQQQYPSPQQLQSQQQSQQLQNSPNAIDTRQPYSPYSQYAAAYNPYGWNRPNNGWYRPVSSGFSLGFPWNLFGLGSYRPGGWGWTWPNRWFF